MASEITIPAPAVGSGSDFLVNPPAATDGQAQQTSAPPKP